MQTATNWLTDNTEILTAQGWATVEEIYSSNINYFTCYDEIRKKFVKKEVKQFSRYFYKGDITVLDSPDIYIEFKKGSVVPKSDLLTGLVEGDITSDVKKKRYKGYLYNFMTESPSDSIMFVRHLNTYTGKNTRNVNYKLLVEDEEEPEEIFDDEEEDQKPRFSAHPEAKIRNNFRHPNYYGCRISW